MFGEKRVKKGFVSGELVWWKEWLIFFGGGGAMFGICLSLDSPSIWGLLRGGLFGAVGFLALIFLLAIVEGWRKDRRRNCEEGENDESNSRNQN